MTIEFSMEELNLLNKSQLKRLCVYYDIEAFPSWNKQKLMKAIYDYLHPPGHISIEKDAPPMSEKVKRIYQSIHSKEA